MFASESFSIAPAAYTGRSQREATTVASYREFLSQWLGRDGACHPGLRHYEQPTYVPKSFPRFFTGLVAADGTRVTPNPFAVNDTTSDIRHGLSRCRSLVYAHSGLGTRGFLEHCTQIINDSRLASMYSQETAKQHLELTADDMQEVAHRLQHLRDDQQQ